MSITFAKVDEICRFIPALNREINHDRGKTKSSKNDVNYIFKNGSTIDILVASERSRGQRRHGGVFEECVSIDQDILNEVLVPTTSIDRRLPDGSHDAHEVVNKSQIFITTSGYKNTFAYQKNIELLIQSIIEPDEVMVMGGTYKTPVAEGQFSEDYVDNLKMQDTYNEDSFDREFCSHWTGDAENAFYSAQKIDRCRNLTTAETQWTTNKGGATKFNNSSYYVLGVDVGRFQCTTEVCVFKVTPQTASAATKSLVNIFTYSAEHFGEQAIQIKKLYYLYRAKAIAIDANGVGAGLVDYMVQSQTDPETGDTLPPFGVQNDEKGTYKKFKTLDTELDAMYLIKADTAFNSEAYVYMQTQISNRKLRLLIDENQAKSALMDTRAGQNMSPEQRNAYLKPYVQTSILKEQLVNLVVSNDNGNIILKRSSSTILKDKFSAAIYGLYYIKMEEERRSKRRTRDFSKFMFFS